MKKCCIYQTEDDFMRFLMALDHEFDLPANDSIAEAA